MRLIALSPAPRLATFRTPCICWTDGPGTLELSSFFHMDSVVKAAGSSTGVINTTFAASDLSFGMDTSTIFETQNAPMVAEVTSSSIGVIEQRVKRLHIGTHSRENRDRHSVHHEIGWLAFSI